MSPRHKREARIPGLERIPSSDTHGRRAVITFQCAPDMARKLADIRDTGLATGKYPWRSRGEVCRFLLMRGLKGFSKEVGIDDDLLRFHEVEAEMEKWRLHREAAQTLLDLATTELHALIGIDEENEAVQRLRLITPKILSLENHVWREWVMKELKRRFPVLFTKPMPKTPLTQMDPADVFPERKKATKGKR